MSLKLISRPKTACCGEDHISAKRTSKPTYIITKFSPHMSNYVGWGRPMTRGHSLPSPLDLPGVKRNVWASSHSATVPLWNLASLWRRTYLVTKRNAGCVEAAIWWISELLRILQGTMWLFGRVFAGACTRRDGQTDRRTPEQCMMLAAIDAECVISQLRQNTHCALRPTYWLIGLAKC